jgi:tetratricopeptide (TPR) repeat protein
VDEVVLKALHKDPAQRYETVLHLADALEGIGRSMFPPSPEAELAEHALISATVAFESDPGDAQRAAALEALVAPAHAWQQVVDTFLKTAERVEDHAIKKQLWFRSARILAHEMKDREAAQKPYRLVLDLDPADAQALDALEQLLRTGKDYEGLAGLLLDRLDNESEHTARGRILREVAELYEHQLGQSDAAMIAYTQALAQEGDDESTRRAIERLCTSAEQWNDVLNGLTEAVENTDRPEHALSLCVLAAGWYETRLGRADVALTVLNRALRIDPAHEPSLIALCELYEKAGAFSELTQLLLHRAESAATPARARDLKAEAAAVAHHKLGELDFAKQTYTAVLREDPSHTAALSALEDIYTELGDHEPLTNLLESKAKTQRGEARVKTLYKLAELYERDPRKLTRAAECYRAVLAVEEKHMGALDGLVRVAGTQDSPEELLEALQQKLKATTTPTQRSAVLLLLARTYDEVLGEPERAVHYYEQVIEVAPGNDPANTALARLYRSLSRFDELAQTLDRHAKGSEDIARKVELLMQAARVLMADLGSPERAAFMCERVLAVSPEHPEALALTSRMRALAGDTASAIDALELLADGEPNADKRAELWVRAGEMLEQREDLDAAIDHYKLALDNVADHQPALSALSRLYEKRGDLHGRAELLLRSVELASDPQLRAARLIELGNFRLDKLGEKGLAADAFASARELDPDNLSAQLGLGRLSLERGDYEIAAQLLEPLLEHTTELSPAAARDACVGAGNAFRAIGQVARAERAYLRAKAVVPYDREVLTKLSEIAIEKQNFADASDLLGDLLDRFGGKMAPQERAEVLIKLGVSYKHLGSLGKAAVAISLAAELCPDWSEPLEALCEVHEAQGNWSALRDALKALTELSESKEERFRLLVRRGDLSAGPLKDRDDAAATYVAALELYAEDRNLLAKLMAVYSEGKDWTRLMDVLVRMADVVDDARLQAKYLLTAAGIANTELGAGERAVELYERALSAEPNLEPAFTGLSDCLTRTKNWTRLAGATRDFIEHSKSNLSPEELAVLWDSLADLYATRLSRVDEAVAAYEQAQAFDPDSRERTERLAEIYARHPNRYGERAITTHQKLLEHNPYRVESYKALRKLYTQLKRPDEAWVLCQALRGLNMAEPDEETFYKRHREQSPATAQECITEELWQDRILHPDQDPLLTTIFTLMQPAAIQELAQSAEDYGVTAEDQIDCANAPQVLAQMLYYASGVTLVPLPAVVYRRDDPGGVSFLFTSPPLLGLGQGALAHAPDQALAFMAGRQLSYFRPGHYMRQLLPTGTALRGWLLAAIRLANPRFPVPESVRGSVDRNRDALTQTLQGPQQRALISAVEHLLREQPEVDVKRWSLGVDLTADRIGFILANSLDVAVAVMRASPADSSLASERERLKELYRYAVSPDYLALRQITGITIGS